MTLAGLGFALGSAAGCRAQVPPLSRPGQVGQPLPPELYRRVEVLIRSKLNVPPTYVMTMSPLMKSDVPGYGMVEVTFSADNQSSRPQPFLVSDDGKTLAQLNKFDMSKDPRQLVSAAGRPSRGGPESAPVTIVGFDDLECPYCAKMNAQLFPAMLERYKGQVHLVYRDFPISQHPWAMRAAVDTNCVGAQSQTGYWNLVDYIHAHAGEIAGDDKDKSVARASETLDRLAREEAKRNKLDEATLNACLQKQDDTAVKASLKLGESLGVEATPVLFINGEKLEGAYPLEDVYRMIDRALVAAGQTPPPPALTTLAPAPTAPTQPATSKQ